LYVILEDFLSLVSFIGSLFKPAKNIRGDEKINPAIAKIKSDPVE
jgi:hypothetical protein